MTTEPTPIGTKEEQEEQVAPAKGRESHASIIVRLAEESGAQFFHDPSDTPFVTLGDGRTLSPVRCHISVYTARSTSCG